MSILGKKWNIRNCDQGKSTFEKILVNRGLNDTKESAQFHDPFLFRDMKKAVTRIKKAISENEKILIFGDYDVDGITAAAILIHALKGLNANVTFKLPSRVEDGYGLSDKFIDQFIEEEVKLVITVDCGISCAKQIERAFNNGIDVIVTDHHTIPENLPTHAFAILHPKLKNSAYPFKELTGAGVALKLVSALNPKEHDNFLDLAALGTIADLGPLVGENKLIVKKGLEILANTKWHGLKRLKELANIQEGDLIDTVKIGFQIAPRINAAGRIGDPKLALSLLLAEESHEEIIALGEKLETLNRQRQEMTETALAQAEKQLSQGDIDYIIIAHDPDWHVGILGLIAGKLSEKYARPAIIMQDFGDNLVASARSPENFNITEALKHCSEYLITFGGHAQAAGFSIKKEKLNAFISAISQYAKAELQDTELRATIEIDCEIKEEEINFEFIEQIEKLAPFGKSNEKPTFLMKSLEPIFINQVGQNGDHLKFAVKNFPVIAFRMGQFADNLRQHRKIDLVFQLEKNRFRNKESVQLTALDFRLNE